MAEGEKSPTPLPLPTEPEAIFLRCCCHRYLPSNLLHLTKVSSSGGTPCQYDASQILCLIPYFAPGSSYTITSEFAGVAEGTAVNTVSVSATQKRRRHRRNYNWSTKRHRPHLQIASERRF